MKSLFKFRLEGLANAVIAVFVVGLFFNYKVMNERIEAFKEKHKKTQDRIVSNLVHLNQTPDKVIPKIKPTEEQREKISRSESVKLKESQKKELKKYKLFQWDNL